MIRMCMILVSTTVHVVIAYAHVFCKIVIQPVYFLIIGLWWYLLIYCSLHQVFGEYFTELEEESIRDNFVIIYELLDEIMDFGYPQTTESKILQE